MYYSDDGIVAYDLTKGKIEGRTKSDAPPHRKEDHYPDKLRCVFPKLWQLPFKSAVHIKAGTRLYCGRQNTVEAVDIPGAGGEPQVSWQANIEGMPHSMVAADGKLLVVTREGRLYAFGEEKLAEPVVHAPPTSAVPEIDKWTEAARELRIPAFR